MLFIAADHAGFQLKEYLSEQLTSRHITFEDFGTFSENQEDSFVPYANQVAKAVIKKNGRGILICGSGVGMCIAANRYKQIRAALCWDVEVARRSREEDDANIICLPARLISQESAWEVVSTFLATTFSHEERYKRRIRQIDER